MPNMHSPPTSSRFEGTNLFRAALIGAVVLVVGAVVVTKGLGASSGSPNAQDGEAQTAVSPNAARVESDETPEGPNRNEDTVVSSDSEPTSPVVTDQNEDAVTSTESSETTPRLSTVTSTPEGEGTPKPGDGSTMGAGEIAPQTPVETKAVREPADVAVLVVNASGVSGIAARGTSKLQAKGYPTLEPTNADNKKRRKVSAIYYVDGYEEEAQKLADSVGVGERDLVEVYSSGKASVATFGVAKIVVEVGRDNIFKF